MPSRSKYAMKVRRNGRDRYGKPRDGWMEDIIAGVVLRYQFIAK